MYLNERAWEVQQEDPHRIREALKEFLKIYAIAARQFRKSEVFVPSNEEIYLRSTTYSIEKWLAEADIEYRRLYLSFWQKRILYEPEDEYELTYNGQRLKGGTEAALNNSLVVSICLDEQWKQESLKSSLYSLAEGVETEVTIANLFSSKQITDSTICSLLKQSGIGSILSYQELWYKKEQLFPHLCFCPSVEEDIHQLEAAYFYQVLKKLRELEEYCFQHGGERFRPDLLSKTTPESKVTLTQYAKEHTFIDPDGKSYLASWHMRFTGIPGRIFFIPDYTEESMLICYIGKKLPNVEYPT